MSATFKNTSFCGRLLQWLQEALDTVFLHPEADVCPPACRALHLQLLQGAILSRAPDLTSASDKMTLHNVSLYILCVDPAGSDNWSVDM